MTRTQARRLAALGVAGATAVAGLGVVQASAHADGSFYTTKTATSTGFGGAVTSVDPEASKVGLGVLKRGGNAVDAAVATAAALGVTEPYSSGLGGGGYFVFYDARTGTVRTIDGRQTAPRKMPPNAFIDPATGKPYPTDPPELFTNTASVGVPGTPATWASALRKWGTYSFGKAVAPAAALAQRGFVVDSTFRQQTLDNEKRFEAYTTTPQLFLPGGDAPAVGSVFRNPDLARTYRMLGEKGVKAFYHGRLATQIAKLVRRPPKSPTTDFPVPAGQMRPGDLARYRTIERAPTHVGYRGYDVYGMAPSSSGGSTVGEALNIMENFDLRSEDIGLALHHYLESTALAFADRAKYVGDPAFVHVPLKDLLSQKYADERACLISDAHAATKPVPAGDVTDYDGVCPKTAAQQGSRARDTENVETTNLTVADKWGNVVSYTLTIEQTGGSGITVPGRGFILNNELTDFSAVYDPADPNRIQPGKRPRSSISPTIVLRGDKPLLALGSPGGSTIITTVLQTLTNRLDRGMTLPEAIAAPRASQRNTASVTAEQSFIDKYGAALAKYGHTFTPAGAPGSSAAEIGAVAALEFLPGGAILAAAEPTRRGGGAAGTVKQLWPRSH